MAIATTLKSYLDARRVAYDIVEHVHSETALEAAHSAQVPGHQVYGIDLSLGQQMIVALTALLASIGAAGIPHAGTVMMVVVLSAVGLPTTAVGLILAVDRILDMCRTAVNVWSDSTAAAVVARFADSKD